MANPALSETLGMDNEKYFKSFIDNFYKSEVFVMLQFVVKNFATDEQKVKLRDEIINNWESTMNGILERELKSAENMSNDKSSALITSVKNTITKNHECNRRMVLREMNERFDKMGI
jgi:hypothetical protein